MSNIKLTATKTITTADGMSFNNRKAALAHGTYLAQKKNLDAIVFKDDHVTNVDDSVNLAVYVEDIPMFIAQNATAILAALVVKQSRKPRTPKVTAAPERAVAAG